MCLNNYKSSFRTEQILVFMYTCNVSFEGKTADVCKNAYVT